MSPQSYIFIGRAGSGKGTQAKLLMDLLKIKDTEHPIIYMETGAEFRKYAQGTSYTAKLTKNIIDNGGLMPEFMCVYLWGRILAEHYSGNEHVVFDGTPRKLLEANLLESVFPFYNLPKPYVIYLDIDHPESTKRLSLRASAGRKDDSAEGIEKRRTAFENDVMPTIEWYRTNPNVTFLDVNGIGPIDKIHDDVVKRLGLS
jgi:adenylate kinase family enzyme